MIKKLLLVRCAPLFTRLARCAPQVLTRRVQDAMASPLRRINFLLREESMSTLSDANRRYSLSFLRSDVDQAVLVFSFISIKQQEEPVGAQRLHFVPIKINHRLFNH